eukprot:g4343.t1
MTKRHKGLLASKLKLLIAQNAEQTKHERRSHSLRCLEISAGHDSSLTDSRHTPGHEPTWCPRLPRVTVCLRFGTLSSAARCNGQQWDYFEKHKVIKSKDDNCHLRPLS